MAKKLYRIPVSWEMMGYIEKEAESLQDAIDYCYSNECKLPEGDYIDDSFIVDNGDGQILEDTYPDESFDIGGSN